MGNFSEGSEEKECVGEDFEIKNKFPTSFIKKEILIRKKNSFALDSNCNEEGLNEFREKVLNYLNSQY